MFILLIILLIFIFLLIISSFSVNINADVVVRDNDIQDDIDEIKINGSMDELNENSIIKTITTKTERCNSNIFPNDINSANVAIGERFINSTIWFSNPFFINYPKNVSGVTYSMSIVDNSEESHALYTLAVSWSSSYGWQKTLYEHSLSNGTRPITPITKFSSNLYGNTTNIGHKFGFIDLQLDKNKIDLPENYNILFHSLIYDESCYKIDLFNKSFEVPYVDSFLNSTERIDIRPGEEKIFELQIKSTPGTKPIINFSDINDSNISLQFLEPEVESDSEGIAFTSVKIRTSPDILPRLYTIPIPFNLTTISFVAYPLIFKNIEVIHLGNTEPREDFDYVTINVLPPLTVPELFNNIWTTFGGMISLIVTSVVTVAVAIGAGSAWRFSKRKNE